MDKIFVEVANTYRTKLALTHHQRVTRLYRRALRELNNWAIDRDLFCRESDKIRAEFDASRMLEPHGGLTQRLVREAEEKVASFTHPDPYVKPYMPGGSKFMRNPAPPIKVCRCSFI
jgi:NADH dehydrogenase (ubiquinone) 1 beta subcomplex subunit 9